jgi:hypothetical protein
MCDLKKKISMFKSYLFFLLSIYFKKNIALNMLTLLFITLLNLTGFLQGNIDIQSI